MQAHKGLTLIYTVCKSNGFVCKFFEDEGKRPKWKNEEMLVTNIFSFSHIVCILDLPNCVKFDLLSTDIFSYNKQKFLQVCREVF